MSADLIYLVELLLGVILTAVIYMGFPFSFTMFQLWKKGRRFEKATAKKIALLNSIILGAFFFLLTSLQGEQWRPLPAVIYYYINRLVLTSNAKG